MGKLLMLLILIVFAFVSISGYLYLTQKIASGELKIAAGEMQLKNGQQMLDQGKAKLAAGKRTMAQADPVNKRVNFLAVLGATIVAPISGVVYMEAQKQIAEGNKQIAQGEAKVKAGEARLAEGQLELSQGKERLSVANSIRIACAYGSIIFGLLSIALGFYWRRTLVRVFRKK